MTGATNAATPIQGGLAALARPQNRHSRVVLEPAPYQPGPVSLDVYLHIGTITSNLHKVKGGCRREAILAAWERFRSGARKSGRTPELWGGRAAERIVEILLAGG